MMSTLKFLLTLISNNLCISNLFFVIVSRLFFQTLSDLSILPVKLSTPICFIPSGSIESVRYSCDRRFISVQRNANYIEIFNLVDHK